jgi:hypothetical protein
MDRDPPLRSALGARRARLLLLALVAVLSLVVLGAGTAAAEARDGWIPSGPSGDEQPVSLARAGSDSATPNWIDGGPVVPLLLLSTFAMLAGGCGLLWSRCRATSS